MRRKKRSDVRIAARVPQTLRLLMKQYVERDAHINESDLIRDSIREKIQHDAPGLYSQFLCSETNEQEQMEVRE